MTLSKVLFSLVSFIGLGLFARPAAASDFYIHGASCWSPNLLVNYNNYGAYNTDTTTTATVYCPLPVTAQTAGLRYQFIAYDRDPSTNVVCTLTASAPDGTFQGSTSYSTSTSGAGPQTVPIAGLGTFTTGASTPVYWSFSCTLPPWGAGGQSVLSSVHINY